MEKYLFFLFLDELDRLEAEIMYKFLKSRPSDFLSFDKFVTNKCHFILGYSGTVTRNKKIATIPNFGPEYRVVISVTVHSAGSGWSNILHFTTGGNCCNLGDRIPAIFHHSNGFFQITSAVGAKGNDRFNYNIELNKEYYIEITQITINGKVRRFR